MSQNPFPAALALLGAASAPVSVKEPTDLPLTTLKDYRDWIIAHWTELAPMSSREDAAAEGMVRLTVLDRRGCFQTERVDVAPRMCIPSHRHPLMDSIEFYVTGSSTIIVNGRTFHLGPHLERLKPRRRCIPIPRDHWHEGTVFEDGLSFLSIQHWHGAPSSVGANWEGPDTHAEPRAR